MDRATVVVVGIIEMEMISLEEKYFVVDNDVGVVPVVDHVNVKLVVLPIVVDD